MEEIDGRSERGVAGNRMQADRDRRQHRSTKRMDQQKRNEPAAGRRAAQPPRRGTDVSQQGRHDERKRNGQRAVDQQVGR